MRKSDVQNLYRAVKKNRGVKTRTDSLIPDRPERSGGCRTCGKVTWKPYYKA